MGFLDPCPLDVLAEAMRDGMWLDVRTDDTTIMRVRIMEIIVRTKGEDIVFRQEWLNRAEEFEKRQFAIDSDAIWRVVKSQYKIEDVKPYGVTEDGEWSDAQKSLYGALDSNVTNKIVATVVHAALVLFDHKPENFFAGARGTESNMVTHRHATIIVLYEMTNLSPHYICTDVMKYDSVQPFVTARDKMTVTNYAQSDARRMKHITTFRETVTRLGDLADKQLVQHYRRTNVPDDYQAVLAR